MLPSQSAGNESTTKLSGMDEVKLSREATMKGFPQLTGHPLHLLDDLLASLPPGKFTTEVPPVHQNQDINSEPPSNNGNTAEGTTATAETRQDLILRAACDLFGENNMSLLENSLALLDEQDRYNTNHGKEAGSVDETAGPVIRKVRARRSGRSAILVRKQRKKSSSSAKSMHSGTNNNPSSQMDARDNDGKKKPNIADDYYLCLLGRDRIDRRAALLAKNNNRNGWARVRRRGIHCTCRSFFQNMKVGGGGRSSSSSQANDAVSSKPARPDDYDVVVCKHLLAAILMPHMLPWSGAGGVEEEVVDDREFAKLVMRASIG